MANSVGLETDVVSLAAGCAELTALLREPASRHDGGVVFALDCAGALPDDPWSAWVADATEQLMLRAGADVRDGWAGALVAVARVSAASAPGVEARRGVELAAVEAVRGVVGTIAVERARDSVQANMVVATTETSDEDVVRAVDYLLDPRLNGFTIGATIRLTRSGHPAPGGRSRAPGRVLITGAAGTIGYATAQAFVAAGYTPILSDLPSERLAQRAAELGAQALALDITDIDAVSRAVAAGEVGESLAAFVSVHGFQGSAALGDLDEAMIRDSMTVNGTSVARVVEALEPLLAAGAPSAICIVSSQCGIKAEPITAAYCAPKFALIGLIEGTARRLAARDISIHALCPGPVDTAFLRAYFDRFAVSERGATTDEVVAERAAAMPTGRFARPEEMGEALRFLAQLDATGVVLAPTGGETLT